MDPERNGILQKNQPFVYYIATLPKLYPTWRRDDKTTYFIRNRDETKVFKDGATLAIL